VWVLAILATASLPVLARRFPAVAMPGKWNFRWDVANLAMFSAVLAIMVGIQPYADQLARDGLLGALRGRIGILPDPVIALSYLVIADGISYGLHRLLHHPRCWHLHAWHHSSEHVNLVSGLRGTPLHFVSTGLPYILAGIAIPVHRLGPVTLAIVGFILLLKNSYTHTNLRIPGQSVMERLGLITPRTHLVHHRADRRFTDSNFGFLFNVWDRLFGTWVDPATVGDAEAFGLDYAIDPRAALFGLRKHALEAPEHDTPPATPLPVDGTAAELQ